MSEIKEGAKAPNFSGVDQNGNTVKLSDFSGKTLIVYFYPKDNTPGCTMQACNLRDNYALLLEKGFAIVGVRSLPATCLLRGCRRARWQMTATSAPVFRVGPPECFTRVSIEGGLVKKGDLGFGKGKNSRCQIKN